MWLRSSATRLGFTNDGRFFRPCMRAVETHLRHVDPSLKVVKNSSPVESGRYPEIISAANDVTNRASHEPGPGEIHRLPTTTGDHGTTHGILQQP